MSKLLAELNNPFNACAHKQQCIDKIAELEQELKDAEARFQAALQYSGEVNTKNQRLLDAITKAHINLNECNEKFCGADEWSWITVAKHWLEEALEDS